MQAGGMSGRDIGARMPGRPGRASGGKEIPAATTIETFQKKQIPAGAPTQPAKFSGTGLEAARGERQTI